MKYGAFLTLVTFLVLGCNPLSHQSVKENAEKSSPADAPAPQNKENQSGPKIGLVYSECNQPWIQREIAGAKASANENGATLTTFAASDRSLLKNAFATACRQKLDGVIVSSARPEDSSFMISLAKKDKVKLFALENPISNQRGADAVPSLLCNFPKVGALAGKAMLEEAKKRNWKFAYTGMIVFVDKDKSIAPGAIDREIETVLKSGLGKNHLYKIQLHKLDIPTAREATIKILRKNAVEISNWFISGLNDFAVVGGARAAENAGIGTNRTIGIGIGGDGALYDLQRPRESGVQGSIVVPSDAMGRKAETEMYDWITNKILPVNYSPSEGVLLDRLNVRNLKSKNHLVE